MTDALLRVFEPACVRHDWGYRNFGRRQFDPTDDRREQVDRRLLRDMGRLCAIEFDRPRQAARLGGCLGAATAVFLIVRELGAPSFFGVGGES